MAKYVSVDTREEDQGLLKYRGLLGHTYVGIAGEPGKRRVCCECTSAESALANCSGANPKAYHKSSNPKSKSYGKWAEVLPV